MFEESRNRLRSEIEDQAKLRFLSPVELTELKALRDKPKTIAEEKARITQLEAKSSQLDQEYQNMAALGKPSEADMRRMKELSAIRDAARFVLANNQSAQTYAQLQKLESGMLDQMQTRILQAVQQVARRHKLAMVVDRQAVLGGGVDLTPEFSRELEKRQSGSRR